MFSKTASSFVASFNASGVNSQPTSAGGGISNSDQLSAFAQMYYGKQQQLMEVVGKTTTTTNSNNTTSYR